MAIIYIDCIVCYEKCLHQIKTSVPIEKPITQTKVVDKLWLVFHSLDISLNDNGKYKIFVDYECPKCYPILYQ